MRYGNQRLLHVIRYNTGEALSTPRLAAMDCGRYRLLFWILFMVTRCHSHPNRAKHKNEPLGCPKHPEMGPSPCEDECETNEDCKGKPGTICCHGGCERELWQMKHEDQFYRTCVVPDPCATGRCKHNGSCIWQAFDKYYCICPLGTLGDNCEIDIDECQSRPCANGGFCRDLIGDYSCCCQPGFTGKNCETATDCPIRGCKNQCSTSVCSKYPNATCKVKVTYTIVTEDGQEVDVTDTCG